jgi:hypothetical protein
LEFAELVRALDLQPAAARMQRKPWRQAAVASKSPEDFAVVLLRAVTEENLTYSYYAVMMAVHRRRDEASLAGIAIECGYSYHAIRQITDRTHYLQRVDGTPVGLKLTGDGLEKLGRVSKRLARYV